MFIFLQVIGSQSCILLVAKSSLLPLLRPSNVRSNIAWKLNSVKLKTSEEFKEHMTKILFEYYFTTRTNTTKIKPKMFLGS